MRKTLAIIVSATILLVSCSTPKPDIPEDKVAQLMFEIHRADVVLTLKNLRDDNLENDSLSYYNYIFQKMGVSRQDFVEIVQWYVHHPDQYRDLYKKVINITAKYEQEEKAKFESDKKRDPDDLWQMKPDWNLPLDGETNPITFNIPTQNEGLYTLSADITCYEDDMSESPRTTIILEYEDGTTTENSVYNITKDGKERHIEVMVSTQEGKKLKCVRGWVLDHSANTQRKHIDCYNIKLKRSKE